MCAVLGLAFGFGVMLLEFVPIVLFGNSTAVRRAELAVTVMCWHSSLLVSPRRLRQGNVIEDKNEEDYIRYSEASCGIDD